MTQVESYTDPVPNSSSSYMIPPEFVTMGKKQFEGLAKMQTELIEKLEQTNRGWLDRMRSEATLASEFATKLTAARSIPETATVYQELASRRLEMAAEDAKRLLADSQKFMETGAHLLSDGWLSSRRRSA
jgi:hypothetical protein